MTKPVRHALVAVLAAIAAVTALPAGAADSGPDADTVSPDLLRYEQRQHRIDALGALFDRQNRVYRVGYRLLYVALDMCPDTIRAAAGFTYANAFMFRGAVRTAAAQLGFGHRVSVVDVVGPICESSDFFAKD